MLLIRQAAVYAPEYLGVRDVLVCGGVIEAVESTVHPFAIGVQWHPECMRGKEKEAEHLFRLFVQRSEKAKDLTLI